MDKQAMSDYFTSKNEIKPQRIFFILCLSLPSLTFSVFSVSIKKLNANDTCLEGQKAFI